MIIAIFITVFQVKTTESEETEKEEESEEAAEKVAALERINNEKAEQFQQQEFEQWIPIVAAEKQAKKEAAQVAALTKIIEKKSQRGAFEQWKSNVAAEKQAEKAAELRRDLRDFTLTLESFGIDKKVNSRTWGSHISTQNMGRIQAIVDEAREAAEVGQNVFPDSKKELETIQSDVEKITSEWVETLEKWISVKFTPKMELELEEDLRQEVSLAVKEAEHLLEVLQRYRKVESVRISSRVDMCERSRELWGINKLVDIDRSFGTGDLARDPDLVQKFFISDKYFLTVVEPEMKKFRSSYVQEAKMNPVNREDRQAVRKEWKRLSLGLEEVDKFMKTMVNNETRASFMKNLNLGRQIKDELVNDFLKIPEEDMPDEVASAVEKYFEREVGVHVVHKALGEKTISDFEKECKEIQKQISDKIESLADIVYTECSICFDGILIRDVQELKCGPHFFHTHCLEQWKETSKSVSRNQPSTCPLCREPILVEAAADW